MSGFVLASFFANLYLYLNGISVPFLGYTLSPQLLGIRSVVNLILFGLFFFFGFVKRK
ncbi:MAG: hypothetical protein AABW61_01630 [Candidatus Aenigmatarchaeota archaeon]